MGPRHSAQEFVDAVICDMPIRQELLRDRAEPVCRTVSEPWLRHLHVRRREDLEEGHAAGKAVQLGWDRLHLTKYLRGDRKCIGRHAGIVLLTHDYGRTWARVSSPPSMITLGGVVCVGRSRCVAVGGQAYAAAAMLSRDGGLHWAISVANWTVLGGVACRSATRCVTGGRGPAAGQAFYTESSGRAWNSARLPDTTGTVSAFACPRTGSCFALGERAGRLQACLKGKGPCGLDIVLRSDGLGRAWSQVPLPSGASSLAGIACRTSTLCYVIAQGGWGNIAAGSGAVLKTTDGGATWVTGTIPAMGQPEGIACPSDLHCVVSGNAGKTGSGIIETTDDGGVTWTKASWPSGPTRFDGVSCPSISVCFAAGGWVVNAKKLDVTAEIVRSGDGGSAWSTVPAPKGNYTLGDIACASATVCMTDGSELINSKMSTVVRAITLSTGDGLLWRVRPLPVDTFEVSGLACPSNTVCYAAAIRGEFAFTDGGVVPQVSDMLQIHP